MDRYIALPPSIYIEDKKIGVTGSFTYLGSTITSSLSLDAEIDKRVAKATAVMYRLRRRVWSNIHLIENAKLQVYQVCVLSSVLCDSET